MIVTQNTKLNVIPGGLIPAVNVSQYDVDRAISFTLFDGNGAAVLESGTTVTIEGTKPDGHGFRYAGTLSGNVATFNTTLQMTVLVGSIECKLTLTKGSQVIGTAMFILEVEKAGINDDTIISDTEIPLIIALATEQMERAEAAAISAANSAMVSGSSMRIAGEYAVSAEQSSIASGSSMRIAGNYAASAEESAVISGSAMRIAGQSAENAQASATSANADALKSEGHAVGQQNGVDVSSDSPYYHNNAKYFKERAESAAAGGVNAGTIATAETTTTVTHAYSIGDQFVYNGVLYTATAPIAIGDTITPNTNCTESASITDQIDEKQPIILASTLTIGGQEVTEVEKALQALNKMGGDIEEMFLTNSFYAVITDDNGDKLTDDSGNKIAGDWSYLIL